MTDSPPPEHDPARLMRLLWREWLPAPAKPGRRPSLTTSDLVEAAIAIADMDGLAALTIRGLALRLQKPTMTIYTYVASKDELVPLMLDTVYGRMVRKSATSAGWKASVRAIADDNRRLFQRHPWAADTSFGRPALGPGTMTKYEYELEALQCLGLSDKDLDDVLTHILVVVSSLARAEANQILTQRDSAQSDEDWWTGNAPYFQLAFDPARFPLAARIGSAAGEIHGGAYNADHLWDFALDRLVDGIKPLVISEH